MNAMIVFCEEITYDLRSILNSELEEHCLRKEREASGLDPTLKISRRRDGTGC
jgi:hypothetical protein